jgi:ribonuclease PH
MIPFRNKDLYVKEMCGSHSIKSVLPALVPDLNYEDLAIADGEMAMLAYAALEKINSVEEQEKIRQDLLAYCRLDTLAMVRIWQKLASLILPPEQLSLF